MSNPVTNYAVYLDSDLEVIRKNPTMRPYPEIKPRFHLNPIDYRKGIQIGDILRDKFVVVRFGMFDTEIIVDLVKGAVPASQDPKDVELASLRSAFQIQKKKIDDYEKWFLKLYKEGYRIKGSFAEMFDSPEFREAFKWMLEHAE